MDSLESCYQLKLLEVHDANSFHAIFLLKFFNSTLWQNIFHKFSKVGFSHSRILHQLSSIDLPISKSSESYRSTQRRWEKNSPKFLFLSNWSNLVLGHKTWFITKLYIDPDLRLFNALALFAGVGASFPSAVCRSWYSWKHGTMHKFVWHSGQWYFVLRRKILPCASIVFQQKLQPSAGPGRRVGQWLERVAVSKDKSLRVDACERNINDLLSLENGMEDSPKATILIAEVLPIWHGSMAVEDDVGIVSGAAAVELAGVEQNGAMLSTDQLTCPGWWQPLDCSTSAAYHFPSSPSPWSCNAASCGFWPVACDVEAAVIDHLQQAPVRHASSLNSQSFASEMRFASDKRAVGLACKMSQMLMIDSAAMGANVVSPSKMNAMELTKDFDQKSIAMKQDLESQGPAPKRDAPSSLQSMAPWVNNRNKRQLLASPNHPQYRRPFSRAAVESRDALACFQSQNYFPYCPCCPCS